MKKTLLLTILLIMALSVMLAACGGGETPAPEPAPTEAPAPAATEAPAPEATEPPAEPAKPAEASFAVMPGGFLEKAIAGEYAGTTVTVDGPFTNPDDLLFAESMKAFEDATGITVNYIGDKEFEGRLAIAVDAGNAPDIADFPQPGALANYARQGHIVDPTTFISEDWLKQQYNQSWLDMATVAGPDG
ncbi:MAG TPA: carbohydrate ABC transporter substrate-binding protein, partial [Caldilineae bacterium]|nr:carbohydrate ABC transporter substrate-binding protein [Caldilineae bacterium]